MMPPRSSISDVSSPSTHSDWIVLSLLMEVSIAGEDDEDIHFSSQERRGVTVKAFSFSLLSSCQKTKFTRDDVFPEKFTWQAIYLLIQRQQENSRVKLQEKNRLKPPKLVIKTTCSRRKSSLIICEFFVHSNSWVMTHVVRESNCTRIMKHILCEKEMRDYILNTVLDTERVLPEKSSILDDEQQAEPYPCPTLFTSLPSRWFASLVACLPESQVINLLFHFIWRYYSLNNQWHSINKKQLPAAEGVDETRGSFSCFRITREVLSFFFFLVNALTKHTLTEQEETLANMTTTKGEPKEWPLIFLFFCQQTAKT